MKKKTFEAQLFVKVENLVLAEPLTLEHASGEFHDFLVVPKNVKAIKSAKRKIVSRLLSGWPSLFLVEASNKKLSSEIYNLMKGKTLGYYNDSIKALIEQQRKAFTHKHVEELSLIKILE